jgi:mono/diheme cytochrome c family protein
MHPPHSRSGAPGALVALLLVSLLLAACGGGNDNGGGGGSSSTTSGGAAAPATTGSKAAQAQGAQVFASAGCDSCHTLKAAGASGNVGPNLDDLKPDRQTVARQVTNGGGGMPAFKGQLSPKEINAVATYVSSVAGQ